MWDFLRNAGLPYCKLYDQGYTSIGYTTNTFPNPALQQPNQEYLPAYLLTDNSLERQGSRVSSSKTSSSTSTTSQKDKSTNLETTDTIISQSTTHDSDILTNTNTLPSATPPMKYMKTSTASISLLLLYDDYTNISSLSNLISIIYELLTESSSPQLLIHEILLYRNNNNNNKPFDKLEEGDNTLNFIDRTIASRIDTLTSNCHKVLVLQDKEYIMREEGKYHRPNGKYNI